MGKSERLLRRMRHPMTVGEAIGVTVGTFLGSVLFRFGAAFVSVRLPDTVDIWGILLFLVAALLVPAFLGVSVASLASSLRHKPLSETLTLFVLIAFAVRDTVNSSRDGLLGFIGGTIRFSFMMVGALLAVFLQRKIRRKRMTASAVDGMTAVPRADRMPQLPIVLLLLAVLSIPAALASLVLSLFVTVGLAGVMVYAMTDSDGVPWIVLIAAGLAVLAAAGSTVFAIAAVFRNRRPMVAGRRVRLETHDGLRQLLVEVCSRVGTRMPDNVLLIPEPQFYVTQSRLGTLDGPLRGRTLALGLPLLKVLSTGELASVVSHEFAHFHGRDLPFSALTAPLYRGLETSVGSLMASQFMPGSAIGWIIRLLVLPRSSSCRRCTGTSIP